jgi:phosphoribosylamine--glycine ligase
MIAEDLAPRLAAAADGALDDRPLAFRPEPHVGVVLASQGYPAAGRVGMPVTGLDAAASLDDVFVFHAGTGRQGNAIVTAGGRVLTVVGRGKSFADAIVRAYDGVSKIAFDGMHYRTDIGRKALEHRALNIEH